MIILGYFFLFLHKKNVMVTHLMHLSKILVMSIHEICLYGELDRILSELASSTP